MMPIWDLSPFLPPTPQKKIEITFSLQYLLSSLFEENMNGLSCRDPVKVSSLISALVFTQKSWCYKPQLVKHSALLLVSIGIKELSTLDIVLSFNKFWNLGAVEEIKLWRFWC